MAQTPEPSTEVKPILKEFCGIQRAKYGPDWDPRQRQSHHIGPYF